MIKTECEKAKDLSPFTREGGERKGGMLYYQALEDTAGAVTRIVTKDTNVEWLLSEIEAGRIYVPTQTIICEKS